MNISKLFSNSIIAGIATIGATSIIFPESAKSAACPDPEDTELTSLATAGDSNSFYAVTEANEPGDGGFCEGTPASYGVTVYKMGFCTVDPGQPTEGTVRVGSAPDYSTCTWTYQNESGEDADFAAGGTFSLGDSFGTKPAVGTYDYAVILIDNTFRIKAKYGPIGTTTYYSTSLEGVSSTSESDWATADSPLNSFDPNESCEAYTNASVSGGNIYAYLLNSDGEILVDDESEGVTSCTGVDKLFGVMKMTNSVEITSATTGLKATFVVTNNGASVFLDNDSEGVPNNEIAFNSGPFSVSFEVIE